ncbi:hypothetical protein CYMTET_53622 [Cymbomonas tetramitiformis]|uniref:Uncharacterized protein n=1 Tax=Cymbomonas tetramitiformis TaxID=36881 RepID=A0AAE0BGN8_9CHLO|nr:hypothetical protein CYMTET_53622 [Cymbomonas tetramitiformis]
MLAGASVAHQILRPDLTLPLAEEDPLKEKLDTDPTVDSVASSSTDEGCTGTATCGVAEDAADGDICGGATTASGVTVGRALA